MELNEVKSVIASTKKGTYVSIHKVKELKKGDEIVVKHSIMLIRLGIEYKNMKVNAGKEVEPLPWGEWNYYPWIISYKGNYYLRVYNSYVKEGSVHNFYMYNGNEITKEQAIEIVGEEKKTNPSSCYTIKLSNLISVG